MQNCHPLSKTNMLKKRLDPRCAMMSQLGGQRATPYPVGMCVYNAKEINLFAQDGLISLPSLPPSLQSDSGMRPAFQISMTASDIIH